MGFARLIVTLTPARSYDLFEHGHSGWSDCYLNWLWQLESWSRKARRYPAFQASRSASAWSFCWKRYGWPDMCEPKSGQTAFACR